MKSLLILLSFVATATSFNAANAQSWYKVASPPDGGGIADLQTDNAGNLYALKSTGYLYYSTNNGNNWTEVAGTAALGGVSTFAVNKATGEIYASTGYVGLQWTSNHGASWNGTWFISSFGLGGCVKCGYFQFEFLVFCFKCCNSF